MREERIYMAKLQSRYNSSHWLKVSKNTPIRLIRIEHDKPYISEPIGYHRGDFFSHEGNVNIALNLAGDKKWFFFPRMSILIIPNKEKLSVKTKDREGKMGTVEILNIPKADKIIQFNPTEILLYCESLSQVGYFLFPVLKGEDGKIVDLSIPVYSTLREVAMNEILYEQTSDYGILTKQASNINPFLRTAQKLQDGQNQSVDVPQGNQ
jgi:hypothetical protein